MRVYFRLTLALFWLVLVCLACYVLCLIPGRRKDINEVFAKCFGWGAFRILRIRMEVEGAEHIDANRPCVFVGNHQNALDVALFGCLIARGTVAIGKRELIWIPFFGPLFALAGNIMIRRQKRSHAIGGIFEGVKEIRSRHVSVFVFPEGTRNRTDQPLLPFKKGGFYLAMKAGVPIVPMACSSMRNIVNLRRRRMGDGVVRIRVLPPVETRGRNEKELSKLVEEVRAGMLKALEPGSIR